MRRDILLLTEMIDAADMLWQQPIGLRNRIVHGYWSIDLEVLHTTATEQLPAFTANLRTVLGSVTDNA
jgi:uncharacterized protein with HEPN domain